MATIKRLVQNGKSTVGATVETFYTSPLGGNGTIITAFSAANDTAANRWYKAYLYDSSGNTTDAIVPLQIVVRNRYHLAPTAVNQLMPPGSTLRIESDIAGGLLFNISGSEL